MYAFFPLTFSFHFFYYFFFLVTNAIFSHITFLFCSLVCLLLKYLWSFLTFSGKVTEFSCLFFTAASVMRVPGGRLMSLQSVSWAFLANPEELSSVEEFISSVLGLAPVFIHMSQQTSPENIRAKLIGMLLYSFCLWCLSGVPSVFWKPMQNNPLWFLCCCCFWSSLFHMHGL